MLVETLAKSLRESLRNTKVDVWQAETIEQMERVVRDAESEWAAKPVAELDGKSPAEVLEELDDPEGWRELLTKWPEIRFPHPFHTALAGKVQALTPMLLEVAGSDAGLGGQMAILCLGEAKVAEAVPVLLDLLGRLKPATRSMDAVIEALTELGENARPGLYDTCERNSVDSDAYSSAIEILVRLPQQERTWQYLRRALENSRELVGLYGLLAGDYRDRRAVFFLNTILEERSDLSRADQMGIRDSIELLGGVLTARAEARLVLAAPTEKPAGKVGRNDPCPCGSGKKYKKCCGA